MFWETVSLVFGWIYFLAWSISFYPQAILNYRRKSVQGLSFDFLYYNVLGFLCYTIYNACFLYSATIQEQYKQRYGENANLVRFNDLMFALHALILSSITLFQTRIYKQDENQCLSQAAYKLILGMLSLIVLTFICCLMKFVWWLDLVYILSLIKLIVSSVKYIPQAYLNYKRQSTVGWSIHNILLDFTGGILSLLQLVIDASLQSNWMGLIGNPIKFFLGNLSIGFDLLFIYQHYVLYKANNHDDSIAESGGYDRLD